jgi:uncharacterized membrane protein
MDKKQKRTLLIIGAVEAVVLIFSLVVSILVLATFDRNARESELIAANGPFIGGLQYHTTVFFCAIVLPVFVILLVDAVYLIIYASRKPSEITDEERAAIEAKAKEEARAEVMAELNAEKKPDNPDEKK